MAEEKAVKAVNENDQTPKIQIRLVDLEGNICFQSMFFEPLPLAYMMWGGRLFVTSRDDRNVYLERRYLVLTNKIPTPEQGSFKIEGNDTEH